MLPIQLKIIAVSALAALALISCKKDEPEAEQPTGREPARVQFYDTQFRTTYDRISQRQNDTIYFAGQGRDANGQAIRLREAFTLAEDATCLEAATRYWNTHQETDRYNISRIAYRCFSASQQIYTGNGVCDARDGCTQDPQPQVFIPSAQPN